MREVRDRPTDYWLGGDEREARGALSAAGDFFRNSEGARDRPTDYWLDPGGNEREAREEL